jgi:hypothetical protein
MRTLARWSPLIVFILAFAAYWMSTGGMHAYYDNFVRLAYAFVHGRLWIDWPGPAIEALEYNGQHYVIEGPVPALLCIPFVLLYGLGANQAVVCAIAAAIGVSAAWAMLGRRGVSREVQLWTTVFLGFGTV